MSDRPYTGVIACMFGMTHGLLMLSDVLVQDNPQALTQRRKMEQRGWVGNGLKKKGGGMHAPPKLDKWCHLSQCVHTRLCRSQLQPMQRDLIVCIYIVSQDFLFFFGTHPCLLQHKKRSAEIWVCCRNAEMLWNTISKRHSAIFQIAIDSVNQSRETFQPLWQALSKASLFLETRFSRSL